MVFQSLYSLHRLADLIRVHRNVGGMLTKTCVAMLLAPRGAVPDLCTQYAALVTNTLGDRDYKEMLCNKLL
jgi:hypothetical protein